MIYIDYIDISMISQADVASISRILPDNFKTRVSGSRITNTRSLVGRLLLYMNSIERGIAHADQLEFALKLNGKLYIKAFPEFNISHSGNYVVLAVAKQSKTLNIGVDIEKDRGLVNLSGLQAYFTQEEQHFLDLSSEKSELFLKLWTRKEAFYKATGTGIYFKNSLKAMSCLRDRILYNTTCWYFKTLSLDGRYWLSCVSNTYENIRLRKRDFHWFKKKLQEDYSQIQTSAFSIINTL